MSTEVLRRAAALMRANAEGALLEGCRDLWMAGPQIDPDNNGWYVCEQRQPEVDWDTTVARLPYDYDGRVARHVARWHPIVALAVADWLEFEASCTERACQQFPAHEWEADARALAVARAYLGPAA